MFFSYVVIKKSNNNNNNNNNNNKGVVLKMNIQFIPQRKAQHRAATRNHNSGIFKGN